MRRSLRIFPLYYAALIVIFVLLPALHLPALDNPGIHRVQDAQAWMWAYSQDFAITYFNHDFFDPDPLWVGHFWSLGVEEHFYLVWAPGRVLMHAPRAAADECSPDRGGTDRALHHDALRHGSGRNLHLHALASGPVRHRRVAGIVRSRARTGTDDTVGTLGCGATVLFLLVCVIELKRPFYWSYPEALGFGFSFLALGSAALIVFAISPQHSAIKRRPRTRLAALLRQIQLRRVRAAYTAAVHFHAAVGPQRIEALAAPLGHAAAQLIGLLDS